MEALLVALNNYMYFEKITTSRIPNTIVHSVGLDHLQNKGASTISYSLANRTLHLMTTDRRSVHYAYF